MPKFKPGNIVARLVLGESWRERNNTDYLHAGFGTSDDDDRSSIISISTIATTDDLPGTGRTVDTHIFQPMGRRIERLAMRFTISSLHPARIAQYIGPTLFVSFTDWMTLHDAIADLCSCEQNGSTIVAGMKGLVRQTQSNSIDRSAAALAALIRVSLSDVRKEIYANVSRIEPIFHLETLARSLTCSHPEKKWYILLVKLARETLIAIRTPSSQTYFDPFLRKESSQIRPSPEAALNLRQRLIRVLKVYRLSGLVSLEDTIGEACAICAEAVSTCISTDARGDAYMNILDTVYFTVIFILRSTYESADIASELIYLVLRTLACWMDAIVYQCIYSAKTSNPNYDMDLLKAAIAFRSVVLVDVDTKYILLPESSKIIFHALLSNDVIPRRNREDSKHIHHIESLIEAAKQRTRRLLRSFDALEIDASQFNCTTQSKIIADPYWSRLDDFGDEWWKCWKITLERSRRVRVQVNSLTEGFREARRIGLERDPLSDPNDWQRDIDHDERNWGYYQLRRASRRKWGQYLRSNMDWDWDLGTCMKRLFYVEKQTPPPGSQIPRASGHDVDVAAGSGGTLKISLGEAQEGLPKDVQIAYKTKTGETRYMSFVPAFPGPGGHTSSETACSGSSSDEDLDPVVAQDLGYGKGSSGGETETEDDGPSSLDDEQFLDCESILFRELGDGLEGEQTLYDVEFEGARVGEEDML